MSNPPPSLPREALMRLGRWSLARVVGRGGMGYVYEGFDDRGRRAAVKVLDRILVDDPANVERFRREAEILARLEHPCLLSLFETGEADGVPFLVTELVLGPGGRPLTFDWILAEARADLATRLDLFEQALEGLAHVHRRGVVHRDFKPSNVLIEAVPGGLRARLVDFGIAGPIGESDPSGPGTRRYMAPEIQGCGADLDVRADVYSAGIFLHEILTGEVPGEGGPVAPAPFRPILSRATATRVEDRHPDVESLSTEIQLARLAPALATDGDARRCLALLHRARGLELELGGKTAAAHRHYRMGERLVAGIPVRFPIRRVASTGLAAAALGIAVAGGVLWLESRSPAWASKARYDLAVRHHDLGESRAAERALASSAEPDAIRLLERIAQDRRAEAEAIDRMMARIEAALRGNQFEEALDLIAERSFRLGKGEERVHAHLVETTGRDYLEDSIRKARALLVAGDRAGARQVLVEARRHAGE